MLSGDQIVIILCAQQNNVLGTIYYVVRTT